jgi:hypothetical protein
VARPLREQFAIASFVVLVPVGVVMVYAASVMYRGEVDQVTTEASAAARVVGVYLDVSGASSVEALEPFLERLPLP